MQGELGLSTEVEVVFLLRLHGDKYPSTSGSRSGSKAWYIRRITELRRYFTRNRSVVCAKILVSGD